LEVWKEVDEGKLIKDLKVTYKFWFWLHILHHISGYYPASIQNHLRADTPKNLQK